MKPQPFSGNAAITNTAEEIILLLRLKRLRYAFSAPRRQANSNTEKLYIPKKAQWLRGSTENVLEGKQSLAFAKAVGLKQKIKVCCKSETHVVVTSTIGYIGSYLW